MSDVRLSVGAQPTLHVDVDEVITVSAHMGGEVYSPPPYTGATTVTPSLAEQVLPTAGTAVSSDITIEAVQSGSVTMRKPTLDKPSGELRSKADVTTGWVTGGAYSGSALILDKQPAATVTPTESVQTAVAQYRWTTGEVKVAGIPNDYVGSAIERRDETDLTASGATVTVPSGYYAETETKDVASGSATTPATTVTANPTVSVDGAGLITATVSASQSVTPTVSAGWVASGTAGTVTVTGSATEQLTVRDSTDMTVLYNTVTAPAGYYPAAATKSVQAGSATASAQKSLNGHTATVTPKVTKTEGYITSGSSNGTAVTVTVNELTSGTKSITANGTGIDVREYASVDVAVPAPAPSLQAKTNVDPTTSSQTITADAGYDGLSSVQINAMPAGSATPPEVIATGASVTTSSNSLTLSKIISLTPTVTPGYVAAGTAANRNVVLTAPMTVQGATTYPASTSDQTIPAGTYLSGAQTIKAYSVMAKSITENGTYTPPTGFNGFYTVTVDVPTFDSLSWLGEGAELIATYAKESTQLSTTSFNGWTPSTTAKTIKSGSSLTATAIDLEEYDYILRWQFYCEPVYSGSETNTARMVKTAQEIYQGIFRRPNSLANIGTLTDAGNACQTINTPSLMEYWNNNSSHTFTWSASYGIYAAATAATFASSTNLQTNLTPKRPSISARCSTTYQSTSNMGKITQASTYFYTQGWLYRVKKSKSLAYNQYRNVCTVFNDGI